MTDAGKKALEELVAGLDGVTPGEWASTWSGCGKHAIVYSGPSEVARVFVSCPDGPHWADHSRAQVDALRKHIARCSPDRIRAIAAYVATLEARVTAAEKRVAEKDAELKQAHSLMQIMGQDMRAMRQETRRLRDEIGGGE